MKLVKFSKFLILVVLCLGFGIKSSLVKGLDINYREDSAANSNFAQLHNVAILGEKGLGLKFDDVFRKIRHDEIRRGGRYEPTGVLQCWSSRLQHWKSGTAFLVKNKRQKLRVISTKHGMINGKNSLIFTDPNPDTSTHCLFLLSKDWKKMLRTCSGNLSQKLNCAKNSDLAHEISHDRNFSKPINSTPQAIHTDLAVLKFKDRGPNVSKVFKLRKLKSTDKFSVEHGRGRRTYLRIPEKGRFIGMVLLPNIGVVTIQSCSVYPRKKGHLVVNDNVMITDCQTIKGFSGSPLVFTNQETGEREVRCVISSESFGTTKGAPFNESRSANVCQAITDKVLDLLER